MTPNLFLATQKVFSPHKWFKPHKHRAGRSARKTEHWDSPVAGIYEYVPGRGWYLIATDKVSSSDDETISEEMPDNKETIKMSPPIPLRYSKVLKRYFLEPDYEVRKKHGRIQLPNNGRLVEAGFFQLDDGVAWVQAWDEHGAFIPGPYKLWCIDEVTNNFRHMLKGDDPSYVHSRNSSRNNSLDRDIGARRQSNESRSTVYSRGPGSTRDGPSVPSTRTNSIQSFGTSRTPSNLSSCSCSGPNSRRQSPQRSPTFPLAEKLKRVATEQEALRVSSDSERTFNTRRGRSPSEKLQSKGRIPWVV